MTLPEAFINTVLRTDVLWDVNTFHTNVWDLFFKLSLCQLKTLPHFAVQSEAACHPQFEAFKKCMGSGWRARAPVWPGSSLCGVSGEAVSTVGQETGSRLIIEARHQRLPTDMAYIMKRVSPFFVLAMCFYVILHSWLAFMHMSHTKLLWCPCRICVIYSVIVLCLFLREHSQ